MARPEPFNSAAQPRLRQRRLGGYNKRVWESLQGRAQRKKGEHRARKMPAVVFIIYTAFLKELAEELVELYDLLSAHNRNLWQMLGFDHSGVVQKYAFFKVTVVPELWV